MLNDRGVPNPTEYKRLHGLRYKQPTRKNSTLWKYFAISDMLCNEMYIGNMVQGKYGSVSYKTKQNKPRPKDEWYRVEGTHEASGTALRSCGASALFLRNMQVSCINLNIVLESKI